MIALTQRGRPWRPYRAGVPARAGTAGWLPASWHHRAVADRGADHLWPELRSALLAVGPGRLNRAVRQSTLPPADPSLPPAAMAAVRALKRHPNPAGVLGEARFRPALAWIVSVLCDPCPT